VATVGENPSAKGRLPDANGCDLSAKGHLPDANGRLPNANDRLPNVNGRLITKVVGNVSPKFLVNSVGYRRLAPVDGWNWANRLNRGTVGENPSAKSCLPDANGCDLSAKGCLPDANGCDLSAKGRLPDAKGCLPE
jgi:hypothetical protein